LAPVGNCSSAAPQRQLASALAGNVGNDAFFTFDLRLGWAIRPVHSWENFRVGPQAAFYNLFNRHNYNGPDAVLAGTLDGGSTSVNGATKATRLPLSLD
jgi:hypothetical protein